MSSFMFCLKQTCDRCLVFFRLRKQRQKYHVEADDTYDERGHITLNAFREEDSDQPKQKSVKSNTHSQNKPVQQPIRPVISDSLLEDSNLLMQQQLPASQLQPLQKPFPTSVPDSVLIDTSPSLPQAVSKISKPISINTQSFKINLESYQNFYEIIQKKTENLQQKLNTPSTVVEIEKSPSSLEIRHVESGKLNIFIYQFKLPCTYSFYSQMLNDYALQKKIDPNIDQFRMLQLYANNLRLNYLSYKKVLIVSPRDFVYLKYTNNVNNQYWDISFSIPHQPTQGKIRGQILLNSCKIIQKQESIDVQVYSQVDMKLSVNAKITKNQAVNEIKKYVQKCEKYVKENYRKELV